MTDATNYNLMSLDEVYKQPLEIDWLIDGIVPNNAIGMIYGASGSGKSHIILSMAAMIANGNDWFGNDTKEGVALVLAGEGLGGITRRLKAIELEHDIEIKPSNLLVSSRAIGIDTEGGYTQVKAAIDSLETPPKIVFIDTLSRHLVASQENSNDDMARFINKLEEIRQKYGCTIILVHHTGKGENNSARGAYALLANIDFCFSVKNVDKNCSFSCDKMKDADDNIPKKNFKIKSVDLNMDDSKGKAITGACVVNSSAIPGLSVSKPNKEEIAISTFNPNKEVWQTTFINACTDNAQIESKQKRFREIVKNLVASGKAQLMDNTEYRLCEELE
jgi:KaiC/GvpD/RAD55 family RecA-like ATPase